MAFISMMSVCNLLTTAVFICLLSLPVLFLCLPQGSILKKKGHLEVQEFSWLILGGLFFSTPSLSFIYTPQIITVAAQLRSVISSHQSLSQLELCSAQAVGI